MRIKINKDFRFHYYDEHKKKLWKSNGIYVNNNLEVSEISSLSKIKLYNRLTRNGIHNIIPFKEETFVVVIKGVFLIYKNNKIISKVTIKGNRPLSNGLLKFNNQLIYGEYYSNSGRKPVKILRLDPYTGDNKIILTLKNKRHIHFVQLDKNNEDAFLIGTGDRDQESGIFSFDLNTNKLTTLGSDSQKWRAVSILQKDKYIYWGSDCPYQINYIYRYNRETSELKKLKKIAGPAYYSTLNSEGKMFIATTIEDRKKHRAIIYMSEDGENWTELKEFKKDIWPERLFGYGIIEFIKNQDQLKDLYINLHGLKE